MIVNKLVRIIKIMFDDVYSQLNHVEPRFDKYQSYNYWLYNEKKRINRMIASQKRNQMVNTFESAQRHRPLPFILSLFHDRKTIIIIGIAPSLTNFYITFKKSKRNKVDDSYTEETIGMFEYPISKKANLALLLFVIKTASAIRNHNDFKMDLCLDAAHYIDKEFIRFPIEEMLSYER